MVAALETFQNQTGSAAPCSLCSVAPSKSRKKRKQQKCAVEECFLVSLKSLPRSILRGRPAAQLLPEVICGEGNQPLWFEGHGCSLSSISHPQNDPCFISACHPLTGGDATPLLRLPAKRTGKAELVPARKRCLLGCVDGTFLLSLSSPLKLTPSLQ